MTYTVNILLSTKQISSAILYIQDSKNTVEIIFEYDEIRVRHSDEYPFFALQKIRRELEKFGIIILIKGSRFDVYPSGMQYSTYGAYELTLGRPAINSVDILDPISADEAIGTVDAQEEYFLKWVDSLGLS